MAQRRFLRDRGARGGAPSRGVQTTVNDIAGNATLATGEIVARVQGARFAYGESEVLKGVDLELRAHEIYALLGPNGAGKTTLIRALCGRLPLTAGSITLLGEDPRRCPEVRRALGLAPQENALYPHLTARENFAVFARLAGVAAGQVAPAVERMLRQTRLEGRADEPVRHLSGGYQRRVNIGAAMLHEPRLLVLDEPTVGVDVEAWAALNELILDLRQGGLAILLATHDLEQAHALADRVGFIVGGRIAAQGTPTALLREAFGDAREIVLMLAAEPDPGVVTVLRELGLQSTQTLTVWSGSLASGVEPSALAKRIEAAGARVKELRVREPDLASLFFRTIHVPRRS